MREATLSPAEGTVAVAEDPAARLAFTDRSLGNVSLAVGRGDASAARGRATALVGASVGDAVFMEQVHGGGVAEVGRGQRGRGVATRGDAVPGVDALVTRATGVVLCVLTADCVPVLLVDPGAAVAAVHAGRRGVAAGVVGACVEVLTQDPGRVVAVIGPAIGGCCYEVPAEMADAVAEVAPGARARTRWGTPALDLPAAVSSQLSAAGVGAVRTLATCTACSNDRWFSHRADAPDARGRQAGVVCRAASGLPGPGDRVA